MMASIPWLQAKTDFQLSQVKTLCGGRLSQDSIPYVSDSDDICLKKFIHVHLEGLVQDIEDNSTPFHYRDMPLDNIDDELVEADHLDHFITLAFAVLNREEWLRGTQYWSEGYCIRPNRDRSRYLISCGHTDDTWYLVPTGHIVIVDANLMKKILKYVKEVTLLDDLVDEIVENI